MDDEETLEVSARLVEHLKNALEDFWELTGIEVDDAQLHAISAASLLHTAAEVVCMNTEGSQRERFAMLASHIYSGIEKEEGWEDKLRQVNSPGGGEA